MIFALRNIQWRSRSHATDIDRLMPQFALIFRNIVILDNARNITHASFFQTRSSIYLIPSYIRCRPHQAVAHLFNVPKIIITIKRILITPLLLSSLHNFLLCQGRKIDPNLLTNFTLFTCNIVLIIMITESLSIAGFRGSSKLYQTTSTSRILKGILPKLPPFT